MKNRYQKFTFVLLFLLQQVLSLMSIPAAIAQSTDSLKRKAYLENLLELNRPHPLPSERARNVFASFERLSFKDSTWAAWQQRTGELPRIFPRCPTGPSFPSFWSKTKEEIAPRLPPSPNGNENGKKSPNKLKNFFPVPFRILPKTLLQKSGKSAWKDLFVYKRWYSDLERTRKRS
ncbi:hypothetical protein [Cyclobacterium xiamenense]|uniref:hypothetical protein n=1 Tax=Cyclobacterium xiamenense TaxID=1297121 RepID=UPI0035CED908